MILPDTLVAELQTFLDHRRETDPDARALLEKLRAVIERENVTKRREE